jgi:hypothetical protein
MANVLTGGQVQAVGFVIVEGERWVVVRIGDAGGAAQGVVGIYQQFVPESQQKVVAKLSSLSRLVN